MPGLDMGHVVRPFHLYHGTVAIGALPVTGLGESYLAAVSSGWPFSLARRRAVTLTRSGPILDMQAS